MCLCFFFFKQKTAYEMRISDWSSDVCSSDLVAYGTSKGGVVSLTKYVATQHAAEGIRCNAIAPGLIMTQAFANSGQTNLEPFMKQILSPRVGQPKDVAAAVAYLASDDAAYVTGTVLHEIGRASCRERVCQYG